MSQITRCPHCKTMFRVVADQLRISEGWVRCGQCEEVFNANVGIQTLLAEIEAPAPTPEHVPEQEAKQTPEQASKATPSTVLPAPLPPAPVAIEPREIKPGADSRVEPFLNDEPVADQSLTSLQVEPPAVEPLVAEPLATEVAPPARHTSDAPQAESEAVDAPVVSFMQGAGAPSKWRKPWVRASLFFAALLLGLGLLLQVLLHERDRLVATAPQLKPLIETLCAIMQCTLAPVRQIESVVMDSSSFNKLRGDVYQLNFSLKNTATIAVAMPAIELSLTDAQDRPLMRRVMMPTELGIKTDVLAPASETSASLTLTVKAQGGVDRITGYRVLAFYP